MSEEKVLLYALGLLLSVVVYFIKGIFADLKYLKVNDAKQDTKLEVMSANHDNLHDGVGELKAAVKDLTNGINNLTIKLTK